MELLGNERVTVGRVLVIVGRCKGKAGRGHSLYDADVVAVDIFDNLLLLLVLFGIHSRHDGLIVEPDKSFVEGRSDQGGKVRCHVVDPSKTVEFSSDDIRSQGSSWIETASGVAGSEQFTEEQGQTDTDGCEESALVLLAGKHVHCKEEETGGEELDPKSLVDSSA